MAEAVRVSVHDRVGLENRFLGTPSVSTGESLEAEN